MSTLPLTLQRSTDQLDNLVKHRGADSISVVMPTYRAGRSVLQNALCYRNLLHRVVAQFSQHGEPEGQVRERLAALFELQRDDDFWQQQTSGVAIYFCDQELTTVALHDTPRAATHVADHFLVSPIAVDAARHRGFFVLTLTWDEADLWQADATQLAALDSELFPVRLRDVVLPADTEEQLRYRTQRSMGTRSQQDRQMVHGQGQGEDSVRADRWHFMREVAGRLSSELRDKPVPLILVATREVAGHWNADTNLPPEHCLYLSAAQISDSQLEQRVVDWIKEDRHRIQQDQATTLERLGTALSHHQASRDVAAIVEAASRGRVEMVLIDAERCGVFEGQRTPPPELSTESINAALLHTLRNGGQIVPIDDGSLQGPLAAIYR